MTKDLEQKITGVLNRLVSYMNLDCQIEIKEEKDEMNRVTPLAVIQAQEDARFLIGRNGQNLKALEHVVRSIFSKEDHLRNLTIDVNNYRKIKMNQLAEMARQAVTRVRNTQKPEALLPMSAYERRVVHMELASYPDITTESIGQEPERRIVIKLYP